MKIHRADRRAFLSRAAAAAAVLASTPELSLADGANRMNALTNRAHILARPGVKEKLTWCFSTVLGCGAPVSLAAPGKPEPILAFRFPTGGSVSVEFTEEALDEMQARRGAWLEVKSDDPEALKKRILEAGLPELHYWATKNFYFEAPGGQVFGVSQKDEMR